MTEERAERAHTRIGNSIYGAILDAPMTNRQKVICFALLRVTRGWRQESAYLTYDEFAEAAGMKNGGTFRDALRDLVTHDVIRIPTAGGAGQPNEWALNPDFTDWDRYSVAPKRVEKLYGRRPDGLRPTARPQAASNDGTAHQQAAPQPVDRLHRSLPVGSTSPLNPANDSELDPRKDRKDSKDKEQQQQQAPESPAEPARPQAAVSADAAYALGITTAANQAVTKRWGEQTRPYFYGASTELAAELIAAKIPLATAQRAITEQVEKSKAPKPPSVISYFRNGILDADKTSQQRSFDRANPVTIQSAAPQRGGQPTSIQSAISLQLERSEHVLAADYDSQRRTAAREWAERPENALAHAAILDAAKSVSVLDIESGMGKRAYESEILTRIASTIGFPTFDQWKTAKSVENS